MTDWRSFTRRTFYEELDDELMRVHMASKTVY